MTRPVPPDPVESFARVEPPSGHARRVLARTGPDAPRAGEPGRRTPPLRWVLPVAATVLVAVGVYVQSDRSARDVPLAPPPPGAIWSGKGVDVPVLPPRAYWEMSAIEEFERLRPPPKAAAGATRARGSKLELPAEMPAVEALADPWSIAPVEIQDLAPAGIAVRPLVPPDDITIVPIEIPPIAIAAATQEVQ